MTYPDYPERSTELEEKVLRLWREEDLFRRTLDATAAGEPFVFYEGPPTANGRPGLHHVISRTIKDLVCRFQTMRGRHVTRIAGWDTHGLPVEIEAEKKLGISGKPQIEAVGVARFNEVCRQSVFTYKEDWERFSERIGYWLDYSRAYATFTPEYIETVWWILGRLHEKKLIYRGHKSVPYCPRCGTALSSHEVAQGYEEVLDPSLYFLCPVREPGGEGPADGRALLVWTTTPWTLPANVALAVHPDLPYVEVDWRGRRLILAEARVEAVFGEHARVTRRYPAAELVGLRYRRPFDLVTAPVGSEDAWCVLPEDFVSAEDGTGIVHLAPAFGADDYAAGQRHGLPMLNPIDDAGRFEPDLSLVGGLFVKAADEVIVEDLERRELVFRHSLELHSYPHCWRCSSPLLYVARDSWYIATTAMRDVMIANNRKVRWHPSEMGTGRFGEWLEGNVDWAISRDRYWGTPLPIWVCDQEPTHFELVGSFQQLRDRAGELPDRFDPHKPWIDDLTWPCQTCEGTMRRTPEVLDVWFDSGSMPFAQWHYPFEHDDQWQRHFPADFVCEGIDQTRGWFYSLMAISSMLGLGPAYRDVVVNDMLLDADGQKMSKSHGNVVDPWDAIETFGADAIRWYLLTVSQPWVPKRFDPVALRDAARRTFDTLANTYRFFALYANLEAWSPARDDPEPAARPVLDRWLLARLSTLVGVVNRDLERYEVTHAARAISVFVVDDLSNWYVRRSRDRFWNGREAADTRAAFRTLSDALTTLARLIAPLTPFHADWLHRALSGGASVHLAPFPTPDAAGRDEALERGMDAARTLARLGRAAREQLKIRVRQPLGTMYVVAPAPDLLSDEVRAIVMDELNVKEIRVLARADELVVLRAEPDFRVLGPRFGARTRQAGDAIRALPPERLQAMRRGERLELVVDGEGFALTGEELQLREQARGDLAIEVDQGFTVALDPTIDDALRLEGVARELVNRIQRLRRDAGLEVSDRIRLQVGGAPEVLEAARAHRAFIARETLAVDLEIEDPSAAGRRRPQGRELDLDGLSARIALDRRE